MDSKDHLEFTCDKSGIITPVELRNPTEIIKQEITEKTTVKCGNEEELPCTDFMCPSEPLKSSMFVNYYDDDDDYFYEVKRELSEDESPQSDSNINSKIVSENMELLNEQKVKIENTEEKLSLILKQENDDEPHQFTIKTEPIEDILHMDNTGANSIHYDALVTPREIQCKLCFKIFQNSYDLLLHNQEHIKVKLIIPREEKINISHQWQYCDKGFNNHENMLAHVGDVHSKKISKVGLCGKQFKSVSILKRLLLLPKFKKIPNQVTPDSVQCKCCNVYFEHRYIFYKHMELCHTGKEDEKKEFKCESCERVYKSKQTLTIHIKKIHHDYGRMFECWCGEQFRSPIHLREHKRLRHVINRKTELYTCFCCDAKFNSKMYLDAHIKRNHYDYGRTFVCWCGKDFRTPIHLREHKARLHDGNSKDTNNEKFQCDFCHRVFESKIYLIKHIKSVHYDYGRVFECPCGKKFRTPRYLRDHKNRHCCRQHST